VNPGPASDPDAPYARLAVVALIRRPDYDSILLLHRTEPHDSWDPPGGRMERGEDLAQAVTREAREETGLLVDVAGPCYVYLVMYKGERLLAVSMACRTVGDPDDITLEAGGATAWRWAGIEEWKGLAERGESSWAPGDVLRATAEARALWGVERSGGKTAAFGNVRGEVCEDG
jgi:8-oxo-dGTP diphosphatase